MNRLCQIIFVFFFTKSGESSLSAHHSGIGSAPAVITDSAPGLVDAHLHTTLIYVVRSNQSDRVLVTD